MKTYSKFYILYYAFCIIWINVTESIYGLYNKKSFLGCFCFCFHFGGYKRKRLSGTRLRRQPVRLDGSKSRRDVKKEQGEIQEVSGLSSNVVESLSNVESPTYEWADARAQGRSEEAWHFLSTRACSQFVPFGILSMSWYRGLTDHLAGIFTQCHHCCHCWKQQFQNSFLFLSVYQTIPGANCLKGLWPQNPCSPSKGKCLLSPILPFTSIPVLLYSLSLTWNHSIVLVFIPEFPFHSGGKKEKKNRKERMQASSTSCPRMSPLKTSLPGNPFNDHCSFSRG